MDIDVKGITNSSHIAGVAYLANTLFVKFKSGAIYRVDNFSKGEFTDMTGAESIGKWYNKFIRGTNEVCVVPAPKRGA